MKNKIFTKVIFLVILVSIAFSIASTTVFAAGESTKVDVSINTETSISIKRKTFVQNTTTITNNYYQLPEEEKNWLEKDGKDAIVKTASTLASLYKLTKDGTITKNEGLEIAQNVLGVVAVFAPYGTIIAGVISPVLDLFKDPEPDPVLEALVAGFEDMNERFDELSDDISNLSDKMDRVVADAIEEITENVKNEIRTTEAGSHVYKFLFSGEGNFDYTVLKNYLYGEYDSSNDMFKNAYARKLAYLYSSGAGDREIEECYIDLYSHLTSLGGERVDYIHILRQYILGRDNAAINSIQKDYYLWLLGNEDELTASSEWLALLFASDLQKTLSDAEAYILLCDQFFLSKIQEKGTDKYEYTYVDGTKFVIPLRDINLQVENLSDESRDEEVKLQMLKDIAFILNAENSYTIKHTTEEFYYIQNYNNGSFGVVHPGQTVYMNRLCDGVCAMFGLDPQKITYRLSNGEITDGSFEVTGTGAITSTMYYGDTEIKTHSIDFISSDKSSDKNFSGGNGTEADPYLIDSVSQVHLIVMGLNKDNTQIHYKLMNDLDFGGSEITALGYSNQAATAFENVFDGNQFTLKNFKIPRVSYSGFFARIGSLGVVRNVNIDKSEIFDIDEWDNTIYVEYSYYGNAGMIAGVNEGKIENCHVSNCSIDYEGAYDGGLNVGGIVGKNTYGVITNCSVESAQLMALYVGLDFAVSIGGIVGRSVGGVLNNCISKNNYQLARGSSSIMKNFYTHSPCIDFNLGGIAGVLEKNVDMSMTYAENIEFEDKCDVENLGAFFAKANKNNVYVKKDLYVYNGDRDKIVASSPKDIKFPSLSLNAEIYTSGNQNYIYNENFLKTDGLKIAVNGEIVDYEILSYYGLETTKLAQTDDGSGTVTILFRTKGDNKILSVDIPISVEKIKMVEFRIKTNPKTLYDDPNDKISLEGGKYEIVWEDGSVDEVADVSKISVSPEYYTQGMNPTKVKLTYNGFSVYYYVEFYCAHTYGEKLILSSTCTSEGYSYEICTKCQYKNIIDGSTTGVSPHQIEIRNADTASCNKDDIGYTGDKWCKSCDKMIERGEVIPVQEHIYTPQDDSKHKCTVCDSEFAHDFSSTETDSSIIYTCITCNHEPVVVEKKVNMTVSRVVIGNSYGVTGRNDEIIVYIKIFENPGITGVAFRIDFDERLDFVRAERGEILDNSQTFNVANTSNGIIGFVAASAKTHEGDGNLLKLVFKLPKDARDMTKYDINIAYTREQFTDNHANVIEMVTMGGSITAVDHLPGDVNSDNIFDMLDTALLTRYLSIKMDPEADTNEFISSYNFNEFYADVDLNGNVGLSDLVIMLQFLAGNNIYEFTSNQFEIILNPNGGTCEQDTITVWAYDEKETDNLGKYPELPTPTRYGYRFDGWYYSFVFSDDETEVKCGDTVVYRPDLMKQVLYARWTEIYYVEYDPNFPENASECSGSMKKSEFEYAKEESLAKIGYSVRGWTFKGWAIEPSGTVVYEVDAIVKALTRNGLTYTLYAVWEANTYRVEFWENTPNTNDVVQNNMLPMENLRYDYEYVLRDGKFKLTGYKFAGWNTQPDGKGEFYADKGVVKNLTDVNGGTVILYAQWTPSTFIVNYDANGGTGVMNSSKHTVDGGDKLLTNAFVRSRYTFSGWNTMPDGSGTWYVENAVIDIKPTDGATITLYAQWRLNDTYIVYYDSNGGEGEMSASVMEVNVSQNLSTNAFARKGHVFIGWGLTSDDGVLYADNAAVKDLVSKNKGITLYAIWEPVPYKVEWNAGANYTIEVSRIESLVGASIGKLSSGSVIYYGDVLYISYSAKTGYTITTKGEEKIVVDETDINQDYIFATVKQNTYTISYNANGGSGMTGNSTHTYDQGQALTLNAFKKNNAAFLGWSTSPSATEPTYLDGQNVINLTAESNATIVLYAVWTKTMESILIESPNRDIELTRDSSHTETATMKFNKKALLAKGYTTIEVVMEVDCKETSGFWDMGVSKNYARIQLLSSSGAVVSTTTIGTDDINNSWKTRTIVLTISINDLDDNGNFRIKYSTVDNGGSATMGWWLGRTRITATAK